MFKHYLKMAIRQILKNKIQYLLSIIGIAVGLLCFSITSYYIRRFNNQFIAWANSDRMANIYVKSAQYGYEDPYIPGEVVQELMGNPITGIGQIAYSYGYGQANISISKENQKEIPYQCSIQNVTKDFPTIFSIQTLEGQTPTLKPGEVFISESSAKKNIRSRKLYRKNTLFQSCRQRHVCHPLFHNQRRYQGFSGWDTGKE